MKILDLLENPSRDFLKDGIALATTNYYCDELALADPFLRGLEEFMLDNPTELHGYMTYDEINIARAMIKLARDTEKYIPSAFVVTLANYIQTKAETMKYNAQDFKAALSTLV